MSTSAASVLIVDDEPDICANLSDILTDCGYRVDVAHDGGKALQLVEGKFYDLALLDLRMPVMDGLELYHRIRQLSAGTAAILITAHAQSDAARSVMAAGAWAVLPKPIDVVGLLGAVKELCDARPHNG